MTNPLIAAPVNEDAQPLDSWEGAGAASSWADLNAALAEDTVDPLQVGFTAAAAGLDTLGVIADPFDEFKSSVAGWLIEHIWFLHEPLDALAGDPTQITAQAQTWHNVSAELARVAADFRAQAPGPGPGGWDGAAGEAYRGAVERCAAGLDGVAADAETLSSLILATGAGVGVVRGEIRDVIGDFLWQLAIEVAVWVTAGFFTLGGSVAAGVARTVLWAVDVASGIVRRISRLLDALSAAGGTAGQLADAMRDTAAQVRAATPAIRQAAGDLKEAAEAGGRGEMIEFGKGLTTAGQQVRSGDAPAPAG